eukprot:1769839-Lingulodinium_polyedra.AAC.1
MAPRRRPQHGICARGLGSQTPLGGLHTCADGGVARDAVGSQRGAGLRPSARAEGGVAAGSIAHRPARRISASSPR